MASTDRDPSMSDPRLDAVALMRDGHSRAIARGHVVHERWCSIAGEPVRMRFAGDALVEPLTRALAHLETSPTTTPALDVELWDSASTGAELSSLMEFVVETAWRAPFGALSPRYEVRGLHSERVHTTYELGSGVLTMFDRQEGRAVYWVRDASELPFYERGAPLRTLVNWWLSQRGLHCVHAGAVGSDGGAVLLTGKGGSGKSTTTLACLESPLRYAADDYCAISLGDSPTVHSLYNTGKLNDAVDLDRQPKFSSWVVNREQLGKEKLLMFLHEHVPDQILTAAPLRAIVLPQVTDRETASIDPVAPAEALRALAPTTMFQLPGAAGQAMLAMAGLVKRLPCYRLSVGRDVASGPQRLAELLDRLIDDAAAGSNGPVPTTVASS